MTTGFGGVARNVAELLARLGAPVALHAAVGDDDAGRAIRAHLAGAGVDVSGVAAAADGPTAEYVAVLAHDSGDLVFGAAAMDAAERGMEARIADALAAVPPDALIFADANLTPPSHRRIVGHARLSGAFLALDAVSVAKSARLPTTSRASR